MPSWWRWRWWRWRMWTSMRFNASLQTSSTWWDPRVSFCWPSDTECNSKTNGKYWHIEALECIILWYRYSCSALISYIVSFQAELFMFWISIFSISLYIYFCFISVIKCCSAAAMCVWVWFWTQNMCFLSISGSHQGLYFPSAPEAGCQQAESVSSTVQRILTISFRNAPVPLQSCKTC